MLEITLIRPQETINKNCAYDICTPNGEKIASLSNGERKVVQIPADVQFIQAKLQWCGSTNIPVQPAANGATFEVTGNLFLNRQMPLLGAMIPLIALMLPGFGLDKMVVIAILMVFLLLLIGTLTVWKNHWLRIVNC